MWRCGKIILVVVLGLSAASLWAVDGNGGYAGSFFQVPIGARPTAMGGAYLAVSNDGAGMLFNPAGLTNLERPLFGSSYRFLALDRSLGYLTLLFPARGHSVIGVNWLYAGSGKVQARDSNGRELGYELGFSNHSFSVVFAKRFEKYFSAALKASYLQASFAEMLSYSVSIDIGVMLYISQFFSREKQFYMSVQDIQVGLVVRNLAAEYRWDNTNYLIAYGDPTALGSVQDDKVPVEIGIGGSARFLNEKLLVALDVLKNEKQSLRPHIGAEYLLDPSFTLRGGYSDGRFTAGTGYLFHLGTRMLAIDYAFSTDRVDEGSEHIFSMDFLF